MREDCGKYIRKMKLGIFVFGTNLPIVLLKKFGYLDKWFNHALDAFFISWIVISFIVTMILITPYMRCLSQYRKNTNIK